MLYGYVTLFPAPSDFEESMEEDVPGPSLLDPVNQGDQQDFFESLVRFYQTLAFWLDEPRLHDPNLYLPALPPQYEPGRLLTLFQYKTVCIHSQNTVLSVNCKPKMIWKVWSV